MGRKGKSRKLAAKVKGRNLALRADAERIVADLKDRKQRVKGSRSYISPPKSLLPPLAPEPPHGSDADRPDPLAEE